MPDTDPMPSPDSGHSARKRRAKVVSPASFTGRTLPHSLEAEEHLLSCCLLDGADVIPRCIAARFKFETFYLAAHGIIYERLVDLYQRQQPTDTACLAEELKNTKQLDAVGGYAFLSQVSSRIPTTAQATYFIDQVRSMWVLRELVRHGNKLTEEVFDYHGQPLAEWLSPHVAWFENALARLTLGGRGDEYTLAKRITEVRADVALRGEGKEDRSSWIYTGFSAFDDIERSTCLRPLGSMDEDHNVLIGGGSSHGKSVLMRQLAGEVLKHGQRVLVYTRETSVKGFIRALASNWSGVDLLHLARTPRDLLQKFDDCCAQLQEMADKRLFVYQHEPGCSLLTIEDLTQHARTWSWRHGAPHMMVTDYLQLLGTRKRANNREQEVAQVSHGHQALTRELGCVSVGGAQLNEKGLSEMRTPRRDENDKIIHRMPNRGDLRESQALYHDADVVWFLYQPPEDCRGQDQSDGNSSKPETWIVQDKRRNGTRGVARCWFEKRFLRFAELNPSESTAAAIAQAATTGQIVRGTRVSKTDYMRRFQQ